MPVTSLDPACALVVIDLQKGIVAMPATHPVATVVDNALALVRAFRAKTLPVVLVRVGWSAGGADAVKGRVEAAPRNASLTSDFDEYLPELAADPAGDILIRKRQWGAFYGTELDLQLRRRGVTNIVLCGIATSLGVESTARDAFERGYNLTFASDAMTDRSAEAHGRALEIIFPRIGEIGTTADILAKLA